MHTGSQHTRLHPTSRMSHAAAATAVHSQQMYVTGCCSSSAHLACGACTVFLQVPLSERLTLCVVLTFCESGRDQQAEWSNHLASGPNPSVTLPNLSGRAPHVWC
eukprot:1154614-Pelagomonas_calceolata.AAC.1